MFLVTGCICGFTLNAVAQTAPLPAVSRADTTGFLTRSAWFLSFARINSGDPRFSWVGGGRVDIDLFGYPKGRVNLLVDEELVLGSERREFDLNHQNIILETSSSYRVGAIDVAAVFHHTSRHLVDRAADRVVAWHTVGARTVRVFPARDSVIAVSLEFDKVVQRTYVDYMWTSQFTVWFERPLRTRAHVFASGASGLVGVDRAVLNRDRQYGARVEGGVHLLAQRAGVDLFAAFERRIDGFPTSREPTSLSEIGFRLGTR